MDFTSQKAKMRRLATDKHETVVTVPEVVGVTVVRVEPKLIVVTVDVEHVQIADGVVAYKIPSVPPLLDFS